MIVNTAYMYMGAAPVAKDFPLWENGKLNVSMTGSSGAAFLAAQNKVRIGNSSYATFTMDASNYSKLRVNANSYGQANIGVYILPGPVNTKTYTIPASATDFEYEIPQAYRRPNLKIQIESNATLFLNSAVLTN